MASSPLRVWTLLLCALTLWGCSCGEEEKPPEDPNKPPSPLVDRGVPSEIEAKVYPQVGATSERPLAFVVAKDPSYCLTVREEFRNLGHVLCIDQPLERAEPRLKKAAVYLKKTYPRHVASPPVFLFTDTARGEVGWRLMLKEPGFFSHAFLAGLEEKVLTNTTLAALHSKGAATLALTLGETDRVRFLKGVTARRGLTLHALGSSPDSLKRAIAIMKAADDRLAPAATSKPAAQPARK